MSDNPESVSSSEEGGDEVSKESSEGLHDSADEVSVFNDGLNSKRSTDTASKDGSVTKGDGELEEGELESDSIEDEQEEKTESGHPRIRALSNTITTSWLVGVKNDDQNTGICKFFQRDNCTWGDNCKYKHVKNQTWQQKQSNRHSNDRRSSVDASSIQLTLSQNEWDRAIREKQKNRGHHRHRSSSSSPLSGELVDPKKIPSLLDLSCKMPRDSAFDLRKRNSGSTGSSVRYVPSSSTTSHRREKAVRRVVKTDAMNHRSSYDRHRHRSKSPKTDKRRRDSSSPDGSTSPIGFRSKNPTRQEIEDYFTERDSERPSAYQANSSPIEHAKPHRKRRQPSSSSSSSSKSSASRSSTSSSVASITSSTEHKKRKNINDSRSKQIFKNDTNRIGSDEDEKDARIEPQKISSESGESDASGGSGESDQEDFKERPQQISSESEESEKESSPYAVAKKRKHSSSSSDYDNSNGSAASPANSPRESKRCRTQQFQPPLVSSDKKSSKRRVKNKRNKRPNENVVLEIDIGEVLEQYENKSAAA